MRSEGLTYDQHVVGAVHRTLARTVSETDIVTFVNLCGFTEPLFSCSTNSRIIRSSSVGR